MNKTSVSMENFGTLLMMNVDFWNKNDKSYKGASLIFDTGASVTTLSSEILQKLGYEPSGEAKAKITTASDVILVAQYKLDKIMIGGIEVADVEVCAMDFPKEIYASGVIGLNVLKQFDIELLFSKKIIRLTKIVD